ncbi:uncharacterized protein LOC110460642 isoform X3 [Mizuhopecten yessoensis]|uniref:uncharacterized protein LOC110460642 isoform X3 n=1 Tax=Mizuhopecten yessoensis TaxID=6573 RepID=UPI000B45DDF6|nr:uncharacterized protein LOC110460642 isoform X3 [Mizuhopecten yessoensis]
MGNESSLQNVLSKEEIEDLLASTPFTESQLRKLMKRYKDMDPDVIFDLFNIYSSDALTHDEIFRLYKLFYSVAISDDHILALTFKALSHPDLETKGQITFPEFEKMVGDQEVVDRMTVDFF